MGYSHILNKDYQQLFYIAITSSLKSFIHIRKYKALLFNKANLEWIETTDTFK